MRRRILGWASAWFLAGCLRAHGNTLTQPDKSKKQDLADRMKKAEEQEAAEVERLYSTKPLLVRMGGKAWYIPANYSTPKGLNEPSEGNADAFGFFLFLPDYGGFTKENWRDRFDKRRIEVLQVESVDKDLMVPDTRGHRSRANPAGYGDPVARFQNSRASLEERPSILKYGLEGFRWKSRRRAGVTWTGKRSNGEFFFFESSFAPGETPPGRVRFPICTVQYYSAKEDLFIAYRYSQEHIAKWREIDDAIWSRLHEWQVK
jgi:hypothetical protein